MKLRILPAALLAWPVVGQASEATGLFVLLFGVPSLLLSIVFAAVALKAPKFGGALCGLLLISEVPLVFWAGRGGFLGSAGAWLTLSIAILVIGLIVALVRMMRSPQEAPSKEANT